MTYRGVSKETGKEVFGYLIYKKSSDEYFIATEEDIEENYIKWLDLDFVSVHAKSIAQAVGINDKNDKPIYGSISVDGVMSEGGDKFGKYICSFENGAFLLIDTHHKDFRCHLTKNIGKEFEITGSQWKEQEE